MRDKRREGESERGTESAKKLERTRKQEMTGGTQSARDRRAVCIVER